MKQILVRGLKLRLVDEAREPGHQQHLGPENQDRQNELNQHRGSFPDNW